MARKIIVISTYGDEPTGENLKKSVAQLEIRRLLADWVVPGISIRRRKISQVNHSAVPREENVSIRFYSPAVYEHHIEPKLVPLTAQNSEWHRYLTV